MSRRGSRIPRKLKRDSIIEAIIELRFETTTKPEFLLVRLSEMDVWKQFVESRLPVFSIPETLRETDPNLRFQPIFNLQDGQRSLRIGPRVLSYHLAQPYIGWAEFGKEVGKVVDSLFRKADGVVVKRLGLRYLNGLTGDAHGIRQATDLDVAVTIGSDIVANEINVNTFMKVSDEMSCIVKVATPPFVNGAVPPNLTVLADIDVFTPDGFEARERDRVMAWVESAHAIEKREFFVLLTDATIRELEEN